MLLRRMRSLVIEAEVSYLFRDRGINDHLFSLKTAKRCSLSKSLSKNTGSENNALLARCTVGCWNMNRMWVALLRIYNLLTPKPREPTFFHLILDPINQPITPSFRMFFIHIQQTDSVRIKRWQNRAYFRHRDITLHKRFNVRVFKTREVE